MSFRFRLETLHKLRVAERDDRRAQLADALRAERILEEQTNAVREELTGMQVAAREAASPGEVNVDRLLDTRRYQAVLLGQIEQLNGQATRVRAESERRRAALVEADREVKVLEKLRDKQWTEFQQRELKQEAKQLDEIAVLRHGDRGEP